MQRYLAFQTFLLYSKYTLKIPTIVLSIKTFLKNNALLNFVLFYNLHLFLFVGILQVFFKPAVSGLSTNVSCCQGNKFDENKEIRTLSIFVGGSVGGNHHCGC